MRVIVYVRETPTQKDTECATAEGVPYNGDAPLLGPKHFRAGLFTGPTFPTAS